MLRLSFDVYKVVKFRKLVRRPPKRESINVSSDNAEDDDEDGDDNHDGVHIHT